MSYLASTFQNWKIGEFIKNFQVIEANFNVSQTFNETVFLLDVWPLSNAPS